MARLAEATGAGRQMAQQARLRRRVRRRAIADAGLIAVAVLLAARLGGDSHEALLLTLLASALGIVVFLHRRSRDLRALARADDWRAEAVAGRGLSLSAWRAGEALPRWAERRDIA